MEQYYFKEYFVNMGVKSLGDLCFWSCYNFYFFKFFSKFSEVDIKPFSISQIRKMLLEKAGEGEPKNTSDNKVMLNQMIKNVI